MTDPLHLLRQANLDKKQVVIRDGIVSVDAVSFRGSDSTSFRKSVRGDVDGAAAGSGYYPISSIAFFVRCKALKYTDYLRSASAEGVEPVSRVDRKVLLDYLNGNIQDCENIDKFAPLATPIQRSARGTHSTDSHAPSTASSLISIAPTDIRHVAHLSGAPSSSLNAGLKRPGGSAHHHHGLSSSLSANASAASAGTALRGDRTSDRASGGGVAVGGISQTISTSRIAELKAKLQKRKLETTKTGVTALEETTSTQPNAAGAGKREDLLSAPDREQRDLSRLVNRLGRQYVNRKSVLHIQGSQTNWSDMMSPFVLQLRTNLEGGPAIQQHSLPTSVGGVTMPFNGTLLDGKNALAMDQQHASAMANSGGENASMDAALKKARAELDAAGYSRYDQERFMGATQDIGFKFDPMATYSSMNVKALKDSGAGGGGAASLMPHSFSNYQLHAAGAAGATGVDKRYNNNVRAISRSSSAGNGTAGKSAIIIIPNISNSLVSIVNVREVLEELHYVTPENVKRDARTPTVASDTVVIHHRDSSGDLVSYKVTNNPARILPEDWPRVVAAFVQGQTWQFKGWPWPTPVEIFNNIRGFHFKWEDMPLDPNIAKWNVQVIQFSRSKRHLDKAAILKFWDFVERGRQRGHVGIMS